MSSSSDHHNEARLTAISSLSPADILSFTIGSYFQQFSHVELLLSVILQQIMQVDIRTIQFLWRDVGVRGKTKATRRAAKERFGADDPMYQRISSILNAIDTLSAFRNDLAHGTFITSLDGTPALGRAGQSFQQMLTNFQPASPATILTETHKLQSIFSDLTALLSSFETSREASS